MGLKESREQLTNNATWIFTKENKWFQKWDEIQKSSDEGMFTQTSSWLMSYEAYGFDYELLIQINSSEEIECGFGCLIVKAGPLKAYVCPWGPFLKCTQHAKKAVDQFIKRAKELNCFLAQLNPASFNITPEWSTVLLENRFTQGNFFKKIYTPVHFNIISLPTTNEENWEGGILKTFSENARRNIKTALKHPVELKKVSSISDLELAYRCFQSNALREGYSIRNWEDIKPSLWDGVQKENSLLYLVEYDKKVAGAIWCAFGGNMVSYVMGGVDKTEKDLKLGHLLQWTCIKEAVNRNFQNYNISVGGSQGVVRFKNSFYPVSIDFNGPYYIVLKPVPYFMVKALYPLLEKNKSLASQILKFLK